MIAVADRLTFLTAELAAATRDHLFAHLERCDPAYPVLLTLANADAIGHDMETVPTKAMQAAGELGTDDEIVAAAAERHGDVLAEARVRFPKLRLLVLYACPVLRPSQAPLVRRINEVLVRRCADLAIPFVDVHDALADPATGP